ncbi:hypothetical protein XAC3810_230027 [Xanthomonas citri pv. citri]|uniref:Uncharacterized protein n=1 Tax=Xanthomonas citri pv. citri TaxID=611301 RepID=A0A0U4YJ69_XANCI|nr:hypothetical protein XAC9322_210027 [Xanthomonas citri pv. citri]CEE19672.1 hypothetical protein XAC3824_200035 [Xanthomonas citri pv. citri]CEE20694.1 hypothetical protein XAC1083_210027 [Xanthomonas citri pv. citri]CEE29005.1 hypothetical protein XAC3810_230027 [Xanthomonas citri pv. citri]CEE31682.1 hypothetical protein XAC2911_200035 [Xanthomonas citri pv. citri]
MCGAPVRDSQNAIGAAMAALDSVVEATGPCIASQLPADQPLSASRRRALTACTCHR